MMPLFLTVPSSNFLSCERPSGKMHAHLRSRQYKIQHSCHNPQKIKFYVISNSCNLVTKPVEVRGAEIRQFFV